MAYILTSFLKTHIRDDFGNRLSVPLDNENGILENIKSLLPHTDKLVSVANDPLNFDDNDAKLAVVCESFKKTGIVFGQASALDARNRSNAKSILDGASLIILGGGKCLCQNRFFREIDLKNLLKNSDALTIGISAGAMNLCKTVANFPEEESDLPEPRWFDGLGIFDGIIIPHFDGAAQKYQLDFDGTDTARDYILPMSRGKEFIGLPNGSYAVIQSDGSLAYFGDVYKISDGIVTKLTMR